jgi:non-ribosomal peptide synthetase component E (peptide arylation enzyme)
MRLFDKVLSGYAGTYHKSPFSFSHHRISFRRSFEDGSVAWFEGGHLNVAQNAIDRHAEKHPDRVAIIWESDDPKHHEKITYKQLLKKVSQLANALKELGVRKGDRVAIYMPMVPEAAYAMLACARIGAIHRYVDSETRITTLDMLFINHMHYSIQCCICWILCRGIARSNH